MPPVYATTPPSKSVSGNILDLAVLPPNTQPSLVSIMLPGSNLPLVAGSGPQPVVSPLTGSVTGTLDVRTDGTYVFAPAPGYSGAVPPVTIQVTSSDGQSKDVPLVVVVSPQLRDASEKRTAMVGSGPVTLDLLANVLPPPGETVNVTSFVLPGDTAEYPTVPVTTATPAGRRLAARAWAQPTRRWLQSGPGAVNVLDPLTKAVTGTIVVYSSGSATFDPAPNFTGQAPPVTYTVTSSDGQVSPGTALITILPGARPHRASPAWPALRCAAGGVGGREVADMTWLCTK